MYYDKRKNLYIDEIRINGIRKSFSARTKPALKRKIADYSAEQTAGPLLSSALDEWLCSREGVAEYKTLQSYEVSIKKIKTRFPRTRLKELTPAMIQAFIRDLAARGYARSTVQKPLSVLSMLYDYYITLPGTVITSNTCESVKIPSSAKNGSRDLMSRKDAATVIESADLPFGLFAYLLMYTGLRKEEALALCRSDFTDDSISITKALSWQTNRPVIKDTKTEHSIRTIPLLKPLAAKLPDWDGYLFSPDNGKTPLSQTQFRHKWNQYCKLAGLVDVEETRHGRYVRHKCSNRICPHQLRHEFASLCLDAGLEPSDTQAFLGHANVSTTLNIYTHIKESRKKKSSEKLEKYLENTD